MKTTGVGSRITGLVIKNYFQSQLVHLIQGLILGIKFVEI